MGRGRFSGQWAGSMFGRRGGRGGQPPINIEDTDNDYVISLFAAGLVKEKVTLTVKNDVLTIAYPDTNSANDAESATTGNFTYQEYRQGAFERRFRLNSKILVEQISASYADGILKVVLPKNPETNQPAQPIPVA